MKPSILARHLWGKRLAIQVEVEHDDKVGRRISQLRKAMSSRALSQLFLLVAKGVESPTEMARLTQKSKFAVSEYLSKLRSCGLFRQLATTGLDMRRRSYEISWEEVAQIFVQDHAFELELYESQLLTRPTIQIHGTVAKTELVILGNGKLGLVKEIVPERPSWKPEDYVRVANRLNQLVWEFTKVFKTYLVERRFLTIREYFLGLYQELSEQYGRLPSNSELVQFYEFMDIIFSKIKPIERILAQSLTERPGSIHNLYRKNPQGLWTAKLFSEAGGTDHAGRYLLNSEAQKVIKPGIHLRIYPSYTYEHRQVA